MDDSQQSISERLQWLDEHFQKLVSLIPPQDYYPKEQAEQQDSEDEGPSPKAAKKLSLIRTIVKKDNGRQQQKDGKQQQQVKFVQKLEQKTRQGGKKNKKKLMGRGQIVQMIKKQVGDDSGVDSNGSVDLEDAKHVSKQGNVSIPLVEKMEVNRHEGVDENVGKNIVASHSESGKDRKALIQGKGKSKEMDKYDDKEKLPKPFDNMEEIQVNNKHGNDDDSSTLATTEENSPKRKKRGKQATKQLDILSKAQNENVIKGENVDFTISMTPGHKDMETESAVVENTLKSTNIKELKRDTTASIATRNDSQKTNQQLNVVNSRRKESEQGNKFSEGDGQDGDMNETLKESAAPMSTGDASATTGEQVKESKKKRKKKQKEDSSDESGGEMMLTWSDFHTDEGGKKEVVHDMMPVEQSETKDDTNILQLREKMLSKLEAMKMERKGKGEGSQSKAQTRKLKEKVKQMRKEKKKAAAETKRKLKEQEEEQNKKIKVEDEKPEEIEDSIKFSKFHFEDEERPRRKSKKTKNMVERQTGKNFNQLIDKAEQKKEKYEKLKETDPDAAVDWLSKEKWRKAVLQAEGAKIKDDPVLLKKSLNRSEKRKKRSRNKMKDMDEKVANDQKARQLKRYRNIQERKHTKKAKKVKRLQKKGKLLLQDRDKM